MPFEPAAGVPLKVAVPLLLGTNVTPPGKLPVKLRVVFGTVLLVVIVNVLAVPTTNVVLSALVIAGGGLFTNNVNVCIASGAMPLVAVIVSE